MAVVKDLSGKKFGRLTAISCAGRTSNGNAKWLCECSCGGKKIVASWGLIGGRTQSCGCIKREQNAEMFKTHARQPRRLYRIWSGMRNRCENKNNHTYYKYGAKGTAVCGERDNSYETFRDWALSHGYSDDLTIDRIDPYGNYEPSNCRWATVKEQNNNRRNNHCITFAGKTMTLAQWCEVTGLTKSMLQHRLDRGWSIPDALQTPRLRTRI